MVLCKKYSDPHRMRIKIADKGRRFELDLRQALAAGAALIAGLATAALTAPPATIDVIVADGPLPPGVAIAALPTRAVATVDPGPVLHAADLDAASTMVLSAPLAEGDPILLSLLVESPAARLDTIGLSLKSDRAVHGDLVAGDRVAVYALSEDASPRRLAPSVLVLDADAAAGGLGSSDVAVLLAVSDRQARDLIRGVDEGSLYLVKVDR
jgi:hypothetical protein